MPDTNDTLEAARSLRSFARLLADVNPDMTIRAVLLLTEVVLDPGHPVSVYARRLDMPLSTTSRLLLDLSETSRSKSKAEGVHLLVRRQNPDSYREVLYAPSALAASLFQKSVGRAPGRGRLMPPREDSGGIRLM